jgi:hypothetical protein
VSCILLFSFWRGWSCAAYLIFKKVSMFPLRMVCIDRNMSGCWSVKYKTLIVILDGIVLSSWCCWCDGPEWNKSSSLPYSQEPATGPYSGPSGTSPHPLTLFFKILISHLPLGHWNHCFPSGPLTLHSGFLCMAYIIYNLHCLEVWKS